MSEVDSAPIALRGLRLIYLRGQNVYTYREPFHLDLDGQGLVYVTGSNQDTAEPSSSGAGKSRLFSLIPRVLFGREYLGKEPVANIWAADGTPGFYELVYWSDGIFYLVREELGKKSAALTFFSRASLEAGEWEPLGAKNKKGTLQAEVAASVNRPLDEFLGTVVWKQGHGHVLIQGTPTERITWLSSLFGLTKYDTIYDDLCRKHDENKDKQQEFLPFVGAYTQAKATFDALESVESLQRSIDVKLEHTAHASATLDAIQVDINDISAKIKAASASLDAQRNLARFIPVGGTLEAVVQEIQSSRVDMQAAQVEHAEYLQQVATIRAQLQSYNTALPAIRAFEQLDPATASLACTTDINSLHASLNAIRTVGHEKATERTNLTLQVKEHGELRATLQSQYQKLTSLGCSSDSIGSIDLARATHASVKATRDATFADHSVLVAQVSSFTKLSALGGQCPTCGNAVDAEHAQQEIARIAPSVSSREAELRRLNTLDAEMASYVDCFSRFSALPQIQAGALDLLEQSLLELRTQADAVIKDIDLLTSARSVVEKYNAIPLDIRSLSSLDLTSRLSISTAQCDIAQARLSRASELVQFVSLDLSATAQDLLRLEEKHLGLQADAEAHKKAVEASREAVAVLRHQIKQLEFARIELDRLSVLNDKYATLMRSDRLLKSLKMGYGKSGFKKEKLRELLTLIQEKLPTWTSILFTENNFSVTVSGDESKLSLIAQQTSQPAGSGAPVVKTYDVSELSGGEQSKLAICVMLTLIDIVADERKCNVLILDEVDRHMDKNALRLMADLLIPNLATRRSSIFMVSHQIPLSHEFDKELVVTKQRACSSLALRNLRSV